MPKSQSRNTGLPLTEQELLIMSSLMASPKHGYAISKHVLEISEGKVKFSAATLYENIAKLLEAGYIERAEEKEIAPGERGKTYRVTGAGAHAVDETWLILRRAGSLVKRGAAKGYAFGALKA
ncbi:MAG: hypothetical protein EXR47_03500 [Dehalococcoidia bacterium]|nr:hypothetical protein [Dehalococcoidia bacterium]